MKKTLFLALFSFILIFFLLSIREANAQLANACYSGSWVQPTCNPATSNPGSCNILPPLFSGAACDQHTGYLRIQDELDAADQTTWTQLYPGRILVGNVIGGWPDVPPYTPPDGLIEALGPIISGSFTAAVPPTAGYNSTGDIAAFDSILAGGALRVNGAGNFYGQINAYNRIVASASVTTGALLSITNGSGSGNATTIAVRQSAGDVGNILQLITADSNTISVDYLGYVNATKDFQIRLDSDNNSAGSPFDNKFSINNGTNNSVFIVDETGSVTANNNLTVSGIATVANSLTAGTVTTNSGGTGQGAIRGKFVESVTGNTCANNQLLVYQTTGSPGWYCVASTNVGTTTVGTLLQVLQAGADASAFGNPVQIGVSGITGIDYGLTLKGITSQYPVFNLKDYEANSNVGAYLGVINFGDGYNVMNQAKIIVSRGASGSGGDYPTNMSFWTTPDGSAVAQESMTILYNGNVGIGTTTPTQKLQVVGSISGGVYYNSNTGDGWLINQMSGSNRGLYYTNSTGRWGFWDNGTEKIALSTSGLIQADGNLNIDGTGSSYFMGSVGIGTIAPVEMLELNNVSAGTARLRITDTAQNPELQLQYGAGVNHHWGIYTNQLDDSLRIWGGSNDRMSFLQNGYVGIGISNPTSRFTVSSTMADGWNAGIKLLRQSVDTLYDARIINAADGLLFKNYNSVISGTLDAFSFRNAADTKLVTIKDGGNLQVYGTVQGNFIDYNGGTCTSGQILIKDASSHWVCGTASGSDNLGNHTATQNLNMTTHSIINVGDITATGTITGAKLNVSTIDPVYTIKGEKYATYVSGMTGVKEETTGLVNLEYNKKTGLAELVLDFDTLEKGSDVWLFAQTIKYTENFDKVVVLLTPSFDGRVWYEKDETAHTITIVGKPINSFAKNYEVSYRLTGPRFDYKQWPNTTDEEFEGLIIE